jgi:F0F1-type ATP synthase assembly protein I
VRGCMGNFFGGVWGIFSLLLTFIIGIHNVIKKCDKIEGEGSYRKTR